MKLIVVALFVSLTTACGPDTSKIVSVLELRGLTLSSEVPLTELRVEKIRDDIELIESTFNQFNIMDPAPLGAQFKFDIFIRDSKKITENGLSKNGSFRVRGSTEWIDLARGGGALGHELMHALKLAYHGNTEADHDWNITEFNQADDVFYQHNGGWSLIDNPPIE